MIRCDDDSITITGSVEDLTVRWSELEAVLVVKQDTFNPTIIRVILVVEGVEHEFAEEEVGDHPLFTAVLERHLVDVVPFASWWPKVTGPESRLEAVTVYRRP